MRDMVARAFAALRGRPMDPEEIEERVNILEVKVQANKMALDQHAADRSAHTAKKQRDLDQ